MFYIMVLAERHVQPCVGLKQWGDCPEEHKHKKKKGRNFMWNMNQTLCLPRQFA